MKYDSSWHKPVLVDEVLEHLAVRPGCRYIDATLGGGGHTQAILESSDPDGRVLAVDRDASAIAFAMKRLESFGERVQFVNANYGDLEHYSGDFAPVDGLLVDAGVSSRQLDDAQRGFSFRDAGPLDMRMGADVPTLAEYLDSVEEHELARVLRTYGEMKDAGRIAARLLEAYAAGRIETTADLAQTIAEIGGGARRKTKHNPATLAFQALRIAVNRELESLEKVLQSLPALLRSGGRAVFIAFHSLEDRVIKRAFRALCTVDVPRGLAVTASQMQPIARAVTRKPVTASAQELENNPRARSAKLRAIEIL